MEVKKCKYCESEFSTTNPKRIYCSNKCKQRMYEDLNGIDSPRFLNTKKFKCVEAEKNCEVPNPELIIIDKKINDLKSSINADNFIITSHKKMIEENKKKLEEFSKSDKIDLSKFIEIIESHLSPESQSDKYKIAKNLKFFEKIIEEKNDNIKRKQLQITELENQKTRLAPFITETRLVKRFVRINDKSNKTKKSKGIITASELAKQKFDKYKLDGEFAELLGDITKNAYIAIFGKPGGGKSSLTIRFANYMTKFGKVLYVSAEEGLGPTMQSKIQKLPFQSDELFIVSDKNIDEIKKTINECDYVLCVIDSIQAIKDSSPETINALREKYNKTVFAIILQSTKSGMYKGRTEYMHDSDIVIEVKEGIAATTKSRFTNLTSIKFF